MQLALEVIAAWFGLDVVLLTAWHLAHAGSRRTRSPESRLRDVPPLTLVPALRA